MTQNKEVNCGKCVHFQHHDTYDYIGFCIEKNELEIKKPSIKVCDEYKKVSFEDLKSELLRTGWLRCLTCNKTIYTVEELAEHIEDELGTNIFSDNVASEEAPTAG